MSNEPGLHLCQRLAYIDAFHHGLSLRRGYGIVAHGLTVVGHCHPHIGRVALAYLSRGRHAHAERLGRLVGHEEVVYIQIVSLVRGLGLVESDA